jgi:tetratricopeptide (TPR) repeat protein
MIKTVAAPIGDLIAEGQAALRSGDAAAAHNSFQAALSLGSNSSALEGLGYASYLAMDFDDAIDQWQQAYAGYRADDNGAGAVRMARMLGYMYGVVVGDWAIGSGWIARAQNLLIVADDSSERGWVALTLGMFERDRSLKHRRFEEAIEVASATQDNNLAFAALAYLGASLVHADRTDEEWFGSTSRWPPSPVVRWGTSSSSRKSFAKCSLLVSVPMMSPAPSNGSRWARSLLPAGISPRSSRTAARTSAA